MDGFVCPQCKALNYPGLMGYPRCHRCHEQLRQCRYCKRQSGGVCNLAEAARPRLQEEDGRPYCGAFDSALGAASAGSRRRQLAVNPALPSAVLTFLVLAVIALAARLALQDRSTARIEARQSQVPVIAHRATAEFLISAPRAWRQPRSVLLRVSPVLEQHYLVEAIEPPPDGRSTGGTTEYRYEMSGGQRLRLTLRLLERSGNGPRNTPLTISVVAGPGINLSSATSLLTNPSRR